MFSGAVIVATFAARAVKPCCICAALSRITCANCCHCGSRHGDAQLSVQLLDVPLDLCRHRFRQCRHGAGGGRRCIGARDRGRAGLRQCRCWQSQGRDTQDRQDGGNAEHERGFMQRSLHDDVEKAERMRTHPSVRGIGDRGRSIIGAGWWWRVVDRRWRRITRLRKRNVRFYHASRRAGIRSDKVSTRSA